MSALPAELAENGAAPSAASATPLATAPAMFQQSSPLASEAVAFFQTTTVTGTVAATALVDSSCVTDGASNGSSKESSSGRSAKDGQLLLSLAGSATAAALATCTSFERLQRILELKKNLDKFRESEEHVCDSNSSSSLGRSFAASFPVCTASSLDPVAGVVATVAATSTARGTCVKSQELSADGEGIVEILSILDHVSMNRDILSKTRIGVTVGKLRTHPNQQIRSTASQLVSKWKASIGFSGAAATATDSSSSASPGASASGSSRRAARSPESAVAVAVDTGTGVSAATAGARAGDSEQTTGGKGESSEYFAGLQTGDAVRDRARAFLWKALLVGMQQQQRPHVGSGETMATAFAANRKQAAAEVAAQIENALWVEYCVGRRSTKDYTAQLKTLKWNLADPKNPGLTLKVLCGVLSPEQLAKMSSADLASDEKKRLRERQKKESMEACQSDWEVKKLMQGAAADGQFPCFKCRTTRTVYFQMQTRSSDEPMTTFVTCLECGNRWKF